jgi:hypothetical protein
MTASVYGGILSRTGRRGGGEGDPAATQGNPGATQASTTPLQGLRPGAGTTRRCPVHFSAADFPRETTACEATFPGPSPGAGPPGGSQYTGAAWGLADSQREQPHLEFGKVPMAIPESTWKCLL